MIKKYTEFLEEHANLEQDLFLENAKKALEDAGFVLSIFSTDRQLKNQTLACDVYFHRLPQFLKSYYGLEESSVFSSKTLDDLSKMLYAKLTFYKNGRVNDGKGGSSAYTFKTMEELVEKTEIYFGKNFIAGAASNMIGSTFRSSVDVSWKVLIDEFKARVGQVAAPEVNPKEADLPEGAQKLLEIFIPGFTVKYKKLLAAAPKYARKLNLMLSAFAEFTVKNINDLKPVDGKISDEFGYLKLGNHKFMLGSMITKAIKRKVYGDAYFYLVRTTFSRTRDDDKELRSILEKLESKSPKELDEYFQEMFMKNRGRAIGSKFGV